MARRLVFDPFEGRWAPGRQQSATAPRLRPHVRARWAMPPGCVAVVGVAADGRTVALGKALANPQ
jgi:hypothetical protein